MSRPPTAPAPPSPHPDPRLARRVSEEGIRAMVHRFYARVRDDAVLAAVFDAHISDWGPHLDRMVAFWSAVLLGRPGFVGDPVGVHRAIEGLGPAHFDRWLELFEETLGEVFEPAVAADVLGRARRMRRVLEAR